MPAAPKVDLKLNIVRDFTTNEICALRLVDIKTGDAIASFDIWRRGTRVKTYPKFTEQQCAKLVSAFLRIYDNVAQCRYEDVPESGKA